MRQPERAGNVVIVSPRGNTLRRSGGNGDKSKDGCLDGLPVLPVYVEN